MIAPMPAAASWHPWQHLFSQWDRIRIDFGEWEKKHILVILNAFSKWPEVRYMTTTTTTTCCTIEVLEKVFVTHGFPRVLASENGPQLTSMNFWNFLDINRISHHKSPQYNPQTNGLAENMVKNVKQWLKRKGRDTSTYKALSTFLRTYHNVPHTSTRKTQVR